MEWVMAILLSGPYILIVYCMGAWVVKSLKPKPKRPNLILIQGGKSKEGPYGENRRT